MRKKLILLSLTTLITLIYYIHPIPLQIPNPDIGTHLLLGKIIINTGNVPHTNLLSFTNPDQPFINTTWLSEVFFYLITNQFGYAGLIIFMSIIMITAWTIQLKIVQKDNFIITIIVTHLYMIILALRTEIRPELFSYLFLSIAILLITTYKNKPTKLLYLFIPLQLLWVNMHIYFIVGNALLFLLWIDSLYTKKNIREISVVTVLAGLIACINPNGIQGALYQFFVFNNYGANVIENKNIISGLLFHFNFYLLCLSLSIVALWMGIGVSYKKVSRIDIFIAILFTLLAFFAIRNMGLFIFGTFYISVKTFSYAGELLQKKNTSLYFYTSLIIVTFLFIAIFSILLWKIANKGIGLGENDRMKPAVAFFINNHLTGPIFNNYNTGSYLSYQLYPHEKVFVDGRPEAYPKEFFYETYLPMESSYAYFKKYAQKYKLNTIIYAHWDTTYNDNPLLKGLMHDTDWKLIYLDSYTAIFVKKNEQNKKVIQRFTISQDNYTIPIDNAYKIELLASYANFFRAVGWYDKLIETDVQILNIDPRNCIVINQIISVMQLKKDPGVFIYQNQFEQYCR